MPHANKQSLAAQTSGTSITEANSCPSGIFLVGRYLSSLFILLVTPWPYSVAVAEQDNMWKDIHISTKSLGINAMSFVLQSVKSRQVGANEAADRLLSHKLYSKSRQLRFSDLLPADKAKRVLKSADDITVLLKNNPDSSDIFQPHWVLDIYPDRPHQMSLNQVLCTKSCRGTRKKK